MSGAPDRTLSGNLGGIAEQLRPYTGPGIFMRGMAVHALIVMLHECRALASALEDAAAERDQHLAMAVDLTSIGRGPDDQVVDLRGLIGAGRSAEVIPFARRGA